MRKRFLIPAIALLVGAASSPLWLVSAADSVSMARLNADVSLERDADYLTGYVPTRTTIGSVFDHHMIEGPEKTVLVASLGDAFDLRRIRGMMEKAGYRGYNEVEIFSQRDWWQRDPDEVLQVMKQRYADC